MAPFFQGALGATCGGALFTFIAMCGSFHASSVGAIATVAGIIQLLLILPLDAVLAFFFLVEFTKKATPGPLEKMRAKAGNDQKLYYGLLGAIVLLTCIAFMAAGASYCIGPFCVSVGFYWGPVMNLIALLAYLAACGCTFMGLKDKAAGGGATAKPTDVKVETPTAVVATPVAEVVPPV